MAEEMCVHIFNKVFAGKIACILLLINALSGIGVSQTRQFILKNNCTETVWVAGAGKPAPLFNGSVGGFELLPGTTVSTSVPVPWVGGRF